MRDFYQWLEATHSLDEKGARTSLGIYPRSYGAAGTHPPLWSTPRSAGAARQLQVNHPDVVKDTQKKKKKKTTSKKKKTTKNKKK